MTHENVQNVGVDWVETSFVFETIYESAVKNTGYVYDSYGEETSLAIDFNDEVKSVLKSFREGFKSKSDEKFIKLLVQFNRVTRQVNIEFDFEDESRWDATPANFNTIAEELRPKLSESSD